MNTDMAKKTPKLMIAPVRGITIASDPGDIAGITSQSFL